MKVLRWSRFQKESRLFVLGHECDAENMANLTPGLQELVSGNLTNQ